MVTVNNKKNIGTKLADVEILGTRYDVIIDIDPDEMPQNADGCMDQSIRTIKIAEFERDRDSLQDIESYRNKVLRHEIIHAFLYESGLWNNSGDIRSWATSEEITDWIAIQSPKIYDVFKELDCM